MKYIDADKLIAELERRIDLICTTEGVVKRDRLQEYETLRDIEDFIDSLEKEQPEVKLEEEINCFLSNATMMNKGEWKGKYPISEMGFRVVARHFYELGLNARKQK